jgi:acetyltransferase
LKIAKRASLEKPVVVLKGGITEETHKATASHTGSLAGSAIVYRALFKQTGILQAENLMELFYFAKTLASEPLPKGNRVQIITNGGGYGIITADQVITQGLALAKMEEKNIAALKKVFPPTVSVSNPMDLVGDSDEKRYRLAIEKALADKNVDMVMVLALFTLPAIDERLVQTIVELRKKAKKPIIVLSIGSQYTELRKKELEQGGVITFKYPEIAARSLKALSDYAEWKRKNKK